MATKRVLSAGQFKNTCLRVMDQVCANGEEVIVTKRGRPVVRIVAVDPMGDEEDLQGMITHQARNLFSTGSTWDAER